MATIYQCANRYANIALSCRSENLGKREKCPGCSSQVVTITGTAALFHHRGDGRYRIDEAVTTYATLAGAQKAADLAYQQDNNSDLVARFIPN